MYRVEVARGGETLAPVAVDDRLGELLRGRQQRGRVHVAQRDDVDLGVGADLLQVAGAHPPDADRRVTETAAREGRPAAQCRAAGDGETSGSGGSGGGSCGGFEEGAT